ncbi:MAG: GAF domain-containing sensor histidine kinase [bacterium]
MDETLRKVINSLEEQVRDRTEQLATVNEQLKVEIKNRLRLEKRLGIANRALMTLSTCHWAITRITDEFDLVRDICRIIVDVGSYTMAWVGYVEQDKTIRPVAYWGCEKSVLDMETTSCAYSDLAMDSIRKTVEHCQCRIVRNIDYNSPPASSQTKAGNCGYASFIALPLLEEDICIGTLNIFAQEPDAFDFEEVNLLTELADDLAYGIATLRTRIERQHAEEKLFNYQKKLRSLASELLLSEERERREIAVGLHDQIGQNLALSRMKLGALQESAVSCGLNKPFSEINQLLERVIQETRTLTFDLSPPILYELGLEPALEWLTEQTYEKHGITSRFEDDRQPKLLDDDVRILIFQAVRELLFNAVKYARANNIEVSTRKDASSIIVKVTDDGVGFETSNIITYMSKSRGFGLFSIKDRLDYLGGSLKIESKPGHGTEITLTASLKKQKTG